LAARNIAGDPSNTGNLAHIFKYGRALAANQPIALNTYGEFDVPTISFAYDPRSDIEASQDRPEITFYAAGITSNDLPGGTILREAASVKNDILTQYSSISNLIDATSFATAVTAAKAQHHGDLETAGVAPA